MRPPIATRSNFGLFVLALLGATALYLAFCSPPPSIAQVTHATFGHALHAAGYTHALCVDRFEPVPVGCDPAEIIGPPCTGTRRYVKSYPFNPNAVLAKDRYGYGDNHCKGSAGGGEAASCGAIEQYVRAGMLPGFPPPGWACSALDAWGDASYLTRNGVTTAMGDIEGAVRSLPGPAPEPAPAPTATPRPTATPAPTPCPAGCAPGGIRGCLCPEATPTPPPTPDPTPEPVDDATLTCVLATVTPDVLTAMSEVPKWERGSRLAAKRMAQLRTVVEWWRSVGGCLCEAIPPDDPRRSSGQLVSQLCEETP